MSHHAEGETGTRHFELTVERGSSFKGGGMLEDMLPCKTMPTVISATCTCEGCQHTSVQEHIESWCMHIHVSKTLLTATGTHMFFVVTLTLVNCILLHHVHCSQK